MKTVQTHTLAWNTSSREWNVIPVNVSIIEGNGEFVPLCTDPMGLTERFLGIVPALHARDIKLGDKKVFVDLPIGYINIEGVDLAMAIGIAACLEVVDREKVQKYVFVGALNINGDVLAVPASSACFCVDCDTRKPYIAHESQCIDDGGYLVWANLFKLIDAFNLVK